jgi:hypothetical protein
MSEKFVVPSFSHCSSNAWAFDRVRSFDTQPAKPTRTASTKIVQIPRNDLILEQQCTASASLKQAVNALDWDQS